MALERWETVPEASLRPRSQSPNASISDPASAVYFDYERISHHRSMISDAVRTVAFKKAIEELVTPESVVVELGAGTGILALFASRAGAKRVYAVERTGMVHLAKRVAASNSGAEIAFIHGDSNEVCLPEPCDVLISDCLGYFALQENMLPDVIAFRDRWLKERGEVIPSSVELYAVPVQDDDAYSNVRFWDEASAEYQIDFGAIREVAANDTYRFGFSTTAFLSRPAPICSIDLCCDQSVGLSSDTIFRLTRNGTVHGICGYFIATLSPRVRIDTAPGIRTHWQQEFFPLSQPRIVAAGDRLRFQVNAVPRAGHIDWVWTIQINEDPPDVQDTRQAYLGLGVNVLPYGVRGLEGK